MRRRRENEAINPVTGVYPIRAFIPKTIDFFLMNCAGGCMRTTERMSDKITVP
jgi:hypothetical protein